MDLSRLATLFDNIQSSDNALRKTAEETLQNLASKDPSEFSLALLTVATTLDAQIPIGIRQSALLYLKKMVPLYWSPGFGSFIGDVPINQSAKAEIREGLLRIIQANDGNHKILNGVIYTIVQIAAGDFPDEWPGLLEFVYGELLGPNSNNNQIIGGLKLLHDLFDDIISEELFFNHNVGVHTIQECVKFMASTETDPEIRKNSALLYKTCLLQLLNPELLEDPNKASILKSHFAEIAGLLLTLLREHKLTIHDLEFKTYLIQIASTLINELSDHELIPPIFQSEVQSIILQNLEELKRLYVNINVLEQNDESIPSNPLYSTDQVLANLIIEEYQLLATIMEPVSSSNIERFIETTLQYALLPKALEEGYSEDYNTYVTDEMEVSPDYTVRHAILDYIIESTEADFTIFAKWSLTKFEELSNSTNQIDWRLKESLIFFISAILKCDDFTIENFTNDRVLRILDTFNSIVLNDEEHELIRSRIILIIPYYLATFKNLINSTQFGLKSFDNIINKLSESNSELLRSSLLISLTNSRSILNLENVSKDQALEFQTKVQNIIRALLITAEEDTPSLLAESVNLLLKLSSNKTSIETLGLLIEIAYVDPSSIQLVLDIEEALETLLFEVEPETYITYLELVLTPLLTTVEESKGVYSAQLGLSLEILHIFISNSPIDKLDPTFGSIINSISNLILISEDDQILQTSGELYNSLVVKLNNDYFNLDVVLQILSKLLDPKLHDSAVLKVGSLVVSILTKFGSNLQNTDYLTLILQATTKRLIQAENTATIENFLSVLCYMVELDTIQTLNFLETFGSLEEILNIWFKNFDVLNGENIETNCKAIMKLYLYGGEKLLVAKVDGDELVDFNSDVIVTRSMRKQQSFQKIPVAFKIIKLLVNELYNQAEDNVEQDEEEEEHHHDHSHDHDHDHNDSHSADENIDDDEGWEDVEDVEFDRLQKFINEESPSTGRDEPNEELKSLLIKFFKEIASQNTLNFKEIYDNFLTDDERKILTDNIV